MTHSPDRDIHRRAAQHASMRHEQARVVSQVTDGAVVSPDTPAPAGPSTFILVNGLSKSVPFDTPAPAESYPSIPVEGLPLTGDTRSDVPLLAGHEDEPVSEPIWYPGGPIDASLLIGYVDHAARRIWDGEDRDPQRFYNHDRKIAGLVQPDEPWFQDVLAASGLRDLCQHDAEWGFLRRLFACPKPYAKWGLKA
ncbi:uncharacterized protein LOC131604846 [Vicia villosa]|uniref:uncharacterized protein LOC131604846 n=1 Tax=Vicia villosa TaxID=3911 RepID=UPI00273CE672|nr:uncharacterized protein LOC131604846 [Vicia villosa]